jgi:hypothetical protein
MRFRGLNHLGTNVLDVLYFVNSDHFSYKQVIIYECNYFSSAGRRVYHRNAAYEDELWREENIYQNRPHFKGSTLTITPPMQLIFPQRYTK